MPVERKAEKRRTHQPGREHAEAAKKPAHAGQGVPPPLTDGSSPFYHPSALWYIQSSELDERPREGRIAVAAVAGGQAARQGRPEVPAPGRGGRPVHRPALSRGQGGGGGMIE